MIYDYAHKKLVEEKSYGESSLHFLYRTVPGRILLRVVVSPTFSRIQRLLKSTSHSRREITRVITTYGLDTGEFADQSFASFHDFFVRRLKPEARPFSSSPHDLIAVADAKLMHYKITPDLVLPVKHTPYDIAAITADDAIAKKYVGGDCLVFRLTIDDCHRYIYPDDGTLLETKTIPGVLHTVQPIAHETYRPYIRNHRVVTTLTTKHFGTVTMIEVGALLVGVIQNHDFRDFQRGQEKGYFELGGSTIIMLFEPGRVRINADIVQYSQDGIETKIKQGATIGRHG